MRRLAETQASGSLRRGQMSSQSSWVSLLKDAMRLWEECISKAILAWLLAWPDKLSQEKEFLQRGEGWRQLSQHVRCWQITPLKGMHRSARLIQSALIMRPCGPWIHNHGQEHVLIDPTVSAQRRHSERRRWRLKRNYCCLCRERRKAQGSRRDPAKKMQWPHTH